MKHTLQIDLSVDPLHLRYHFCGTTEYITHLFLLFVRILIHKLILWTRLNCVIMTGKESEEKAKPLMKQIFSDDEQYVNDAGMG